MKFLDSVNPTLTDRELQYKPVIASPAYKVGIAPPRCIERAFFIQFSERNATFDMTYRRAARISLPKGCNRRRSRARREGARHVCSVLGEDGETPSFDAFVRNDDLEVCKELSLNDIAAAHQPADGMEVENTESDDDADNEDAPCPVTSEESLASLSTVTRFFRAFGYNVSRL
ncbi:hypothetical protein J6590_048420 [Homalodisca vitripennis]|nr:hypothetical protein J6590_048420 [Homalodisca vitripennis]